MIKTKQFFFFMSLLIASFQLNAQTNNPYNPHSLQSHGYLRTGLGQSFPSGEMVQFQLPETTLKSRLGNEANHYAELQFNYKYQPENQKQSYEMVTMLSSYLEYRQNQLANSISLDLAQLYFKWNNAFNNADFWIGRRYYQRTNIEILDFFWINPIQNADVGVGLENIEVIKNTALDIALIRFTDKLKDTRIPTEKALIGYHKMDIRLRKIQISEHTQLNLLQQTGYRPAIKGTDYKSLWGLTLGAWNTHEKGNFYNRNSVIYRKGINMIQNQFTGKTFLEIDENGSKNYDLANAYDIQMTSDIRWDDKENFGFLGAIFYHYKDYGIQTSKNNEKMMQHIDFSGRFSKYISQKFRLTAETSYGYVNITDGAKGGLFKLTLSPEWSWSKGMFSRPSIRPFITYAKWSDDLKGKVGIFNGNDVFEDKTQGVTAGIQMEIWW